MDTKDVISSNAIKNITRRVFNQFKVRVILHSRLDVRNHNLRHIFVFECTARLIKHTKFRMIASNHVESNIYNRSKFVKPFANEFHILDCAINYAISKLRQLTNSKDAISKVTHRKDVKRANIMFATKLFRVIKKFCHTFSKDFRAVGVNHFAHQTFDFKFCTEMVISSHKDIFLADITPIIRDIRNTEWFKIFNRAKKLFDNQFITSVFAKPSIVFKLFSLKTNTFLLQFVACNTNAFKLFLSVNKLRAVCFKQLLERSIVLAILAFSVFVIKFLVQKLCDFIPRTNQVFIFADSKNVFNLAFSGVSMEVRHFRLPPVLKFLRRRHS